MRKLILFLIISVVTTASLRADLVSGPRGSFLWNQFNYVTVLDTFALAASDFGVALLRMNPETGVFSTDTTVLLSNKALSIKVAGDLAVVRSSSGIASILDLSALPRVELIGEIDIGTEVSDAVLVGSDLYLACGYSGLRHYTFVDDDSLVFVDSSPAPVHCVQVEFVGPYLIVLDDYNGLLRYEPGPTGLGAPLSRVLVPRQVERLIVVGDTLVLPLVGNSLLYLATFDPAAMLVDSISFSFVPNCVFAVDSLVAALRFDYALMETVSTVSGDRVLAPFELEHDLTPIGDAYFFGTEPHLLLVSRSRGLLAFNLTSLEYDPSFRSAYARPGLIKGLVFHDGRLATGGGRNPLELLDVDLGRMPLSHATSFREAQVNALADGGQLLFSYSSTTRMISSTRLAGDSISLVGSTYPGSLPVRKLIFHESPMSGSPSLLLALGRISFDVISVSPTGNLQRLFTIGTVNEIHDAIVVDTFLLIAAADSQLLNYRISNSLSMLFIWSVKTPAQLEHMAVTGPRGVPGGWSHHSVNLAFSGPTMYEIYLLPDGKPRVYYCSTLPVEVTNSALGNNALYTIGPGSCGLLDLSFEIPKMTAFGGYGGNYISAHDSILATSDGSSIHLYEIPVSTEPTGIENDERVVLRPDGFLLQNYPNPFNPQTTIAFELPRRMVAELTIYDILGRRVVSLLNGELPSGMHSVEWRGIDASGDRVSSGVYFYRLAADGIVECKKMVFLK